MTSTNERWADHYLPIDCPCCGRRRVLYAVNEQGSPVKVRCEKCGADEDYDSAPPSPDRPMRCLTCNEWERRVEVVPASDFNALQAERDTWREIGTNARLAMAGKVYDRCAEQFIDGLDKGLGGPQILALAMAANAETVAERDALQAELEEYHSLTYHDIRDAERAKAVAEAELEKAQAERDAARIEHEGATNRSKLLLTAKNEWMDRAVKAEAEVETLRAAIEDACEDLSPKGVHPATVDRVVRTLRAEVVEAAKEARWDAERFACEKCNRVVPFKDILPGVKCAMCPYCNDGSLLRSDRGWIADRLANLLAVVEAAWPVLRDPDRPRGDCAVEGAKLRRAAEKASQTPISSEWKAKSEGEAEA